MLVACHTAPERIESMGALPLTSTGRMKTTRFEFQLSGRAF
jgi:non-ribosomal peptide synthetase component E (peptide arylation enzyme)